MCEESFFMCNEQNLTHFFLYNPQSRAKCNASRQPSATCPGERQMESGRTQTNMQPLGSAFTKDATTESWRESFQDLQSWCHQQPLLDELHTPQITKQDEFNFSVDVYRDKDLDEQSFIDSEGDLWGNDLLGTCQTLGEENNNNNFTLMKLPYNNNTNKMYEVNSFIPSYKSPLKSSSGNILLSQSIEPQLTLDNNAIKNEEPPFVAETSLPLTTSTGFGYFKEISNKNFKVPQQGTAAKKERPVLKLNIQAATAAKTTPILSTPDVLKPVVDVNAEFDLVKFLDSSNEDDSNLLAGSSDTVVAKDHNYTEPWPLKDNCSIKSEPLSPVRDHSSTNEPVYSPEVKTESGRVVKRRRKDSSSDFVFDSDADFTDDSADWSPTPAKKKTRQKRKSKEIIKKEDCDDSESLCFDKYRELRDRNNEASRRSRYNRKQRDVEMKQTADQLQKENIRLKVEAKRMEKLVVELRAIIMKSVVNRNVQN